jgi:general secretion pathway protein D
LNKWISLFLFLFILTPSAFSKENKLTEVTFKELPQKIRINITATEEAKYKSFKMSKPPAVVIDLFDTLHSWPQKTLIINKNVVKKVRSSQFQTKDKTGRNITRIVIDLTKIVSYNILQAKNLILIDLNKGDEKLISLNFQDTDINDVLKFYSEITGLTVIPDDKVRGRVTVINPLKLSLGEVIRIVEAVLELKGFTFVKINNIVKVVSKEEAVRKGIETRMDWEVTKPEDRVITQIIPIKFMKAEDVVRNLKNFISPKGNIFASERTNILVITDTASNINRLMEIIKELDIEVKRGKLEVKVVPLKYADETELSKTLNEIFTLKPEQRIPYYRATRRVPRRAPEEVASKEILEELMGKVKIIPDTRLHALVIVTTTEYFPLVQDLISKLDVEIEEKSAIRVYPLQNAKAKDILEILNSLFEAVPEERERVRRVRREEEREGVGKIAGLKGKITLVADERTNSLVIATAPENFPLIESILEELDVRTPQVLIEVLIAEITLTPETALGIEWKWGEEGALEGVPHTTDWETQFGLQAWPDTTKPTDIKATSTGFNYWLLRQDKDIGLMLRAWAKEGIVNILSTPRILASNNQEAKISIGEEVPIKKTIASEGFTTTSYEYKDVSLELTITPRISANRDVSLDVKQVVAKIGEEYGTTGEYTFLKREAETSVLVKDKQTIILGGLIRDDSKETINKIPLLGDIPFLGAFFRHKTTKIEKTELMVFITPYVVFTPEEAEELTEEQKAKAKSLFLKEEGESDELE